jgi:hypothetical protein
VFSFSYGKKATRQTFQTYRQGFQILEYSIIGIENLDIKANFTNQILPKTTWDSLFESYNPFSTIAVSRVLQKKAHSKSKQIKQHLDKLLPFSLQNRTTHKLSIPWNWNISQSHKVSTSHKGRIPSLKRCKSVGTGKEEGRARWQ